MDVAQRDGIRIDIHSLSRELGIPVIPLVVLIDGIVSCLRTYSTQELTELTRSLEGAPYDWEISEVRTPGAPFPLLYAIGWPRSEM